MMKTGMRLALLFAAYGTLGLGGDFLVGLLASDGVEIQREVEVERDVERIVDVQVEIVRADGECAFRVDRQLTVSVDAGDVLSIEAGAGDLRVEGRDDVTEVVAVGRVCASHAEYAEELLLSVEREVGQIELSAHYPDQRDGSGRNVARIDLTVLVPSGMGVEIEDSSGDIEVLGVGDLDIDDSSGDIRVAGVGHVDIDDSSGEIQLAGVTGSVDIADSSSDIQVAGVTGSVHVEDGSGSVQVSGVGGSVEIEDGSGSIQVVGVSRDVRVEDGGGGIEVRDVGGDFVVERDGRGGVSYANVAGRVDIPEERRRR